MVGRIGLALLLPPLVLMAPAVSVVAVPGCGCTGIALAGLQVEVEDGPGGPDVCDATVTARDGAYVTSLMKFAAGEGGCLYSGVHERPGSYTIEVTSGGRSVTVPNVAVETEGFCGHVRTVRLTATLPPAAM
jgi:hypothetical protein